MIVHTESGDIFESGRKHIAFAINTEGYNDSGFAGVVARKYWPELADCGEHELGTVLTKKVGDVTFYALVCHSLRNGWGDNQSEIIRQCFDNIQTDSDEPVTSISIGAGFIGIITGADFRQIVYGMHKSNQRIILNGPYSLSAVLECCEEEKAKAKVKRPGSDN